MLNLDQEGRPAVQPSVATWPHALPGSAGSGDA